MADDIGDKPTAIQLTPGNRPGKSKDISDNRFVECVETLVRLQTFVLQEGIALPEAFQIGDLNLTRFRLFGRWPTEHEWMAVESKTEELLRLLDQHQRVRFSRSAIPRWLVLTGVASAFLGALALVIASAITGSGWPRANLVELSVYILWSSALGVLGSVAYVGMNALSVQDDITFDMSNGRLLILRLGLGAMFAFVITTPIGFPAFKTFISSVGCSNCATSGPTPGPGGPSGYIEGLLLLTPFALGFSTPLVIMILNRLVESVQAFFGKSVSAKA